MQAPLAGLHHVTAVATDAQRNVDFYAGLLGLRLIKRTVNFDDPSAHHLYYGDEMGSPGSVVTFFCWPGARRGRVGPGQATAIVLSAPAGSLGYWRERLGRHHVASIPGGRFGEETLALADPDGIPMELVAVERDPRRGWTGAGIPAEHALRGMHAAELTVRDPGPTEELLAGLMGCALVRRDGDRARFQSDPGGPGRFVDVVGHSPEPRGTDGAGTIHHLAYRVPGDRDQLVMKERLAEAGHLVSDVRDRDYFRSIYYREPGGVLFEIATDGPGFTIDEKPESLGSALKLPKRFEPARARIEQALPPVHPAGSYS
ncbi:MAG: ring-cleaving dioxygenase [Opitutaceae bacterium]